MSRHVAFYEVLIGCLLTCWASHAVADWSTFQHDAARSGATSDALPEQLRLNWSYQSPTPPRSAWDEPAIWDGWSKTHNLTNRQVFDKAFHVAAVGDAVYFGSSVEDQVVCLDAQTGMRRWQFYTEGPVRLAPTVVNRRVYVGSDDGYVYCLSAADGSLLWRHRPGPSGRRLPGNERVISQWPVRTSVVVVGDRAYCGAGVIPSDGVYVCALDAQSGAEIWKTGMQDLPAQGYLLASSSRLYVVTSRDRPLVFDAATGERLYQVRGGTGGTYALLTGDTLYYGPNKTGNVNMAGPQQEDVLASFAGNHMIVAKPLTYLHSGDKLSGLDRETYVRLYAKRDAQDATRKKLVEQLEQLEVQIERAAASDVGGAAEAATNGANNDKQPRAKRDRLQRRIKAIEGQLRDLNQRLADCLKWSVPCDCPRSLILAHDTLVAGGDGQIRGFSAKNGQPRWTHEVPGKAYGLAVHQGRLFVSTDRGAILCFSNTNDISPANAARDTSSPSNLPPAPVRRQSYQGPFVTKRLPPVDICGPIAEFVDQDTIRIQWQTRVPMTSQLWFDVDLNDTAARTDPELKTEHTMRVDGIHPDIMYEYRIGGRTEAGNEVTTEAYRFDAHFNYLPAEAPNRPSPFANNALDAQYAATAETIVERLAAHRGYALVVGSPRGQLAYHLAKRTELQIVVVDSDSSAVAESRNYLTKAGLYGSRVSVHLRESLDKLPYGPLLFNLIVSDRMLQSGELPTSIGSLYPCLRPVGGQLILGSWQEASVSDWRQQPVRTLAAARDGLETLSSQRDAPVAALQLKKLDWQPVSSDSAPSQFWIHSRAALPGTGQWTHQYASPNNSSCSDDQVVNGPLTTQWWGRPGARPMPDRGNRNPPPVSAQGRLFVQGNRTLFGLDAYNGTILWSKQIPNMRRANMPRDGSNMVASGDLLWLSTGGQCLAFDGQTGEQQITRDVPVPESLADRSYEWGYVARVGDDLVGSGVRRGAHYRGDAGQWYESAADKDVARVTSDYLFAAPWYRQTARWVYQRGVILNSTITIADGVVYFIESHSPLAKQASTGRLLEEVLQDQVLVALDLRSGKILWEKPYDFSDCHHVTYMTHGNATLLIAGTDPDRRFHVYAFDATDGKELWRHDAPDKKGHHTGQLAHPTIVGDTVYFNKHAYRLRTGEILYVHDFNWHGCGVMSASRGTIFSRYEYHGMYDLATKERTELLGLRSGCWLSLIPSGGLLLAPETSAGCSCGHSLQTSIAYIPKRLITVHE